MFQKLGDAPLYQGKGGGSCFLSLCPSPPLPFPFNPASPPLPLSLTPPPPEMVTVPVS